MKGDLNRQVQSTSQKHQSNIRKINYVINLVSRTFLHVSFSFVDSFSSLARKSSLGKENTAPPLGAGVGAGAGGGMPMMPMILMPPPDLSEETLMAPEHNEIVAKIKFISNLVDIIIDVARYYNHFIQNCSFPANLSRYFIIF